MSTLLPIPGIARAASLKILGVTISSKLWVNEHVGVIISSCHVHNRCTQSAVLRSHGMCDSAAAAAALQTVYRTVIISKFLYTSSAWWGQGRIQGGCPGCPDTRPLLRVPFFDYRNSIVSKIDATHVIKVHSIIQFVMPWNAGKMNQRVSRFSNFLGEAPRSPAAARLPRAYRGLRPSGAPFWWIGHPLLSNPRSATGGFSTATDQQLSNVWTRLFAAEYVSDCTVLAIRLSPRRLKVLTINCFAALLIYPDHTLHQMLRKQAAHEYLYVGRGAITESYCAKQTMTMIIL